MLNNEFRAAIAAGRPQAEAFAFASEWKDLVKELTQHPSTRENEPDSAFAKEAIWRFRQKFAGKAVMIGFDVGIFKSAERPDEIEEKRRELEAFDAIIADLRRENVTLSIYLEGAFGETGSSWEHYEAERFITSAVEAGLTTAAAAPRLVSAGGGNVRATPELRTLLRRWDEGGHFWMPTLKDLREFKARGFAAAEIDNLDRPLDDVRTKVFDRAEVGLTGRLGFYRTYADEYYRGTVPTLILKNIDSETVDKIEARLGTLGAADDPTKLPRAMFADFHILEIDDLGETKRNTIAQTSERIGIQTLFSKDTDHYRVQGAFGAGALGGLSAVSVQSIS
jgi:hypothetical protein